MSPVHLINLVFQKNQPEYRQGLSRTRRPGRGHIGHSGGWQHTEGTHTHPSIHFPIQQEPQTIGLERYGSSSSAPTAPQRFISVEHGKQEVQPEIPLGRTGSKLAEDLSPRDRLQRPYGDHQRVESHQEVQNPGGEDSLRLTRSKPNKLSSGCAPFRNQQISGQELPFFTIPECFQEKTRIQGKKQDHLQPKEERVRSNDPEASGFGERSAQEPEVAISNSRISGLLNRFITVSL
ncbi:hypothetical protein O181_104354 [Austropuccinia psidii MF-1]|uniref:Uncharacterized protein n=1 Tax=Austropuccinia psidii MF-1 TaxID=1389203 RepID=A0A9Q3JMY8_9BASI|nr:hypothetical protein [Austropuccinia psidii MF-1]